MPPFAGQGMLSSLRDANNLGWKLDLVMRGHAPDSLLDSYEDERRAHVRAWTEISLAEGRISCELDPSRAAERDARLLAGEELPRRNRRGLNSKSSLPSEVLTPIRLRERSACKRVCVRMAEKDCLTMSLAPRGLPCSRWAGTQRRFCLQRR